MGNPRSSGAPRLSGKQPGGDNPILFLATLDNTLVGRDRDGTFTFTSSGSVRYRDGSSVGSKAALIEEATTNLLLNPSAEVNATTSTSARAGAVIARDATIAAVGSASFKITTPNATGGEGINHQTASALGLTGAARSLIGQLQIHGSGTVNVFLQLRYADASFGTGAATTVTLTGTDQLVTTPVLVTNPAKTVDWIRLIVDTGAGQAITFWDDAAQIEEKDHATSYADGTLGTGYAWTGTAHASASTRAATTLTIPGKAATFASLAFRYSEDGATWQTGYLTAAGAIGTNGLIAVSGSDLVISSARSLTIGPVAGYDRALTSAERARLGAIAPANWWGALN